jgi:hypothetical protein
LDLSKRRELSRSKDTKSFVIPASSIIAGVLDNESYVCFRRRKAETKRRNLHLTSEGALDLWLSQEQRVVENHVTGSRLKRGHAQTFINITNLPLVLVNFMWDHITAQLGIQRIFDGVENSRAL